MYDFKIEAADKATLYRDLASALEGLVAGETDGIANMANAAALIWESAARRQLGRLLPQCRRRAGARAVPGPPGLHPHPVRQRRVRRGGGDAAGAAGRGRPRLPRPHRLRQRVEQRDRRADRSATASCSACSTSTARSMARFDAEDEAGLRQARARSWRERFSSACSSRSSLSAPGMIITGHGSLPASLPVKLATSGPGIARRRGAEHQRGDILARADMAADRCDRLALADDDFRRDPGRVHDLADRRRRRCLRCAAAALPRSPPGPRPTGRSPAARRPPAPRPRRRSWRRGARRSAARRAPPGCRRSRPDRCAPSLFSPWPRVLRAKSCGQWQAYSARRLTRQPLWPLCRTSLTKPERAHVRSN